MYIYIFLFLVLRMTDSVTSQNTDLPSWDTLYINAHTHELKLFDEQAY
jgi:hypothetical protein